MFEFYNNGNNNGNAEPSGVAGIADDWTRAVLTKILANTYITIRDLIFKKVRSDSFTDLQ